MPPLTDPKPQRRRVCFSFAAYAKSLVSSLRSAGVTVVDGLTDVEFTTIESTHGFTFPPDLRSILREGLPISHSFPNWRSSPPDHIRSLLTYPTNSFLSYISRNPTLFCGSSSCFGPRVPDNTEECVAMARCALEKAPALVPLFGNYYIPSSSCSGNPIFFVRAGGGAVQCCCFDLMELFKELVPAPAWAAKEARWVEVWSELAEEGGDVEGGEGGTWGEIRRCLREGGWGAEEVRELLMDGGDGGRRFDRTTVSGDREGVLRNVRVLAMVLLRAGWSREDVVYCMGSTKGDAVTWQVDPTKEGKEVMICMESDALMDYPK